MIVPTWIKAIAAVVFLGFLVWGTNSFLNYEQGIGYARRVAEDNAAIIDAERRLTKLQEEAQNAATENEKQRRHSATAADTAIAKLRERLAAVGTSLDTASVEACRATAARLSAVFGECQAEYRKMGEAADGHAADSLMFQNAWPR